eukprot:3117149-Rhodomonas_salina.1
MRFRRRCVFAYPPKHFTSAPKSRASHPKPASKRPLAAIFRGLGHLVLHEGGKTFFLSLIHI